MSPTGTGSGGDRIDSVLLLLAAMIVFFTAVVVLVCFWFPNDGQTFQAFVGLLGSLIGAFLLRIKPKTPEDAPGRSSTVTVERKESDTITP